MSDSHDLTRQSAMDHLDTVLALLSTARGMVSHVAHGSDAGELREAAHVAAVVEVALESAWNTLYEFSVAGQTGLHPVHAFIKASRASTNAADNAFKDWMLFSEAEAAEGETEESAVIRHAFPKQ